MAARTGRLALLRVQPGAAEGFFRLGVRRMVLPAEGCELRAPPPADRVDQCRVGVAHEVGKGRRFAVLLAHEDQREVGGQQDDPRRQFEGFEGDETAQAVAMHAVADLVVILSEYDQAVGVNRPAGAAMAPLAVLGILSVVDEPLPQSLEQLFESAEITVVALTFTGEDGVQGMMQVVAPLGVQAEAAEIRRADQPRIV